MKNLRKSRPDTSIEHLLTLPPAARTLRARNSARHLRESVCRELIDTGYAARFTDPQECLRRQELAVDLAGELLRRQASPARFDLLAEASAYFGNARRVVGELAGARRSLREAEQFWRSGTREQGLLGLLLEFQASLAEAERRFGVAGRLLRRAAAIWSSRGDLERLARVSVLAGIVRAYAGETEGAMADLREGLRLTSSLPLVRCAVLSMAWTLVDAGRAEAALDVVEPYRNALAAGGAQVRLKLLWIQGRIGTELDCDAAGAGDLEAARQGYEELAMLQEWALVSLDLAVHHGRFGRLREVRRLAGEAAPVVLSLGVAAHAIVAAHLEKLAAAGEALPAAARVLSGMIRPRRAALV
jgi:hypothetical protein